MGCFEQDWIDVCKERDAWRARAEKLAKVIKAATSFSTCCFCFLSDKMGHDPKCIGKEALAEFESEVGK